mmetsp:Transcript_12421/g.12462  ORF Transcript_12421/g.12462 Transcript_12421/m.12462 type:complete len:100 (-) Transcript_12421:9-308(-)
MNKDADVYAVHQVSFNLKHQTFATCGGDGSYFIWDKEQRKRLKSTGGCDVPITACRMNPSGSLMAYSFGYDWAKGYNARGSSPVKLFLHPTTDKEIRIS